MTFGDWELFKSAVVTLREVEKGNLHLTSPAEENVTGAGKIPRNSSGKDLVRISVTSPTTPSDRAVSKSPNIIAGEYGEGSRKTQPPTLRPNVLEKQVQNSDSRPDAITEFSE